VYDTSSRRQDILHRATCAPDPVHTPVPDAADATRAGGSDPAPSPVTARRDPDHRLGRVEFTGFLAMSMALAALGIDLMLPAFAAMRGDLGLPEGSTATGGLITAYFLGLAVGQVLYGPLADRFGRRPALLVGYAIYGVGALAATVAPTLGVLLFARFVWGFGAAGPRVVTLAVVRDSFEGERMSRAMSFIMAVFILVPVVSPTIGAAIAAVAHWRWIFGVCVVAVIGMGIWARRLPETLPPEHRLELRVGRILEAGRHVVTERRTVGYTLAMTALYGVFTSYIASAELVFGEVFDAAASFPALFGGLAAVMGLSMLVNARVVGRVGLRRLAHGVLVVYLGAAASLVALALLTGGRPPLWTFVVAMAAMLAAHALLIPNLNTIAMQPMAAVAGTAAAVIGAVQIAVGALLGAALDRVFDGTITPLAFGFLGYGVLALALVAWAERGVLFQPLEPPPPEPVPARSLR
jgi:MFS transporter, DHA1 family, multidrug resistance protein